MTSLGAVSIVITFIQLLLQLTNWDLYALRSALDSMNGSIDLRCIFPLFAEPLPSLIWRLSIPFIGVAFVASSVGIAALASTLLAWLSAGHEGDEHDETAILINSGTKETTIEYPATALLSSVSLSVVKFFYFGTAISAHEYIFASHQAFTAIKYVQNHPWIPYSAATQLIGASIPAILIFDLILPIAFLFLCWKVRRSFYTPQVQIYFGTLFETFSRRCFWWEMVIILKKLSIALVLRGLPPTDAFQSSLVVIILSGIQFAQVMLQPWKRRTENMLDTLSALILIGSALASRQAHLDSAYPVSILFFVISCLFALLCIALIAHQTWTGRTEYDKRMAESIVMETDYDISSTLKGGFVDSSDTEEDEEGTAKDNLFGLSSSPPIED